MCSNTRNNTLSVPSSQAEQEKKNPREPTLSMYHGRSCSTLSPSRLHGEIQWAVCVTAFHIVNIVFIARHKVIAFDSNGNNLIITGRQATKLEISILPGW